MERSLPIKRSSFFVEIRLCEGGMSRRVPISALRFGESLRVPSSVFTIHPRISLVVVQYPYPCSAFVMLTKSFASAGEGGEDFLEGP